MWKTQFWAIFLTIVIAIPITTITLIASAYLTDHMVEIAGSIANIDFFSLAKYRDLILEIEAIGMILAIVIIMAMIVIIIKPENAEQEIDL